MKETLQKTADILVSNIHNIESISLLEGKMGIAIFLYHYGRYSGNNQYSDIADELLSSVYNSIDSDSNELDISFDQGIAGFAWAIRYLINKGFAEGDPDELLSEVENTLFKKYITDSQSKIPLSTIGMYFQSVIADEANIEKYDQVINNILDKYEFYFLCLLNKPRPTIYINSVLFVLSSLIKYDQYKDKTKRVIFKILLHLSNADLSDQIDKDDLYTLYRLLSSIKYDSKEKEAVMRNIERSGNLYLNNEVSLDYLWQNFLFSPKEKVSLRSDDINKYIDSYTFPSRENSLSIFKGLAGIGLTLILQEHL